MTIHPALDSGLNAVLFDVPDEQAVANANGFRVQGLGLDPIMMDRTQDGYSFSVPAIKRVVDNASRSTWDFRMWNEGNVTYAMVIGYYRVLDNLAPYDTTMTMQEFQSQFPLQEFRIIVETNPAIDGWRFSNYRGEESRLARWDSLDLLDLNINRIREFESNFRRIVDQTAREVSDAIISELFSNYRMDGNILQIDIGDAGPDRPAYSMMIFMRLFNRHDGYETLLDWGLAYCDGLPLNDFTEWRMPEQWEIGHAFMGRYFSWEEELFLSMPPDGRFWGPLLEPTRSIRTGNAYLAFISRSVEDQGEQRGVYYIEISTRHPHDMREIGNRRFAGKLQENYGQWGQPIHENYEGARDYVFCINTDPQENAAFKASLMPTDDVPIDLISAAKTGDISSAAILIEAGAELDVTDEQGRNAMWHAISEEHAEFVRLLVAEGVSIDEPDDSGKTALYYAATSGNVDIVETLLDAGAHIHGHETASGGWTPLVTAALNGNKDVVRVLLSRGADADFRSEQDQSLISMIIGVPIGDQLGTIQILVDEYGARFGQEEISAAREHGRVDIADFLESRQSGEFTSPATISADDAYSQGAPMTGEEREVFLLAVQGCWVVDPSSQAAGVTVTIAFELDRQGMVVVGPDLVSSSGGTPLDVEAAFQSARRAVIRCGRDGFDLPEEKFEQWRLVEMTFDPSGMRLR